MAGCPCLLDYDIIILHLLSEFLKPLLGHTISWCRCWAAIRLSHPVSSSCAVYEEVNR